jgi:hypothetical protein
MIMGAAAAALAAAVRPKNPRREMRPERGSCFGIMDYSLIVDGM